MLTKKHSVIDLVFVSLRNLIIIRDLTNNSIIMFNTLDVIFREKILIKNLEIDLMPAFGGKVMNLHKSE